MKIIHTLSKVFALISTMFIVGCSDNSDRYYAVNSESERPKKSVDVGNLNVVKHKSNVVTSISNNKYYSSDSTILVTKSVPQKKSVDFSAKEGSIVATGLMIPNISQELTSDNVKLLIDSGAVKENVEISVVEINKNNTAEFPSNMENLTHSNVCYRMLPDGQKFEKDITIAIRYDSTQLPFGYTANDIYTFFYNEEKGVWQQIERDSVDKK